MKIININQQELFEFLLKQSKPLMEVKLIKHFIDKNSVFDDKILFVQHFSLFHALYKLKLDAGENGYYLHIDPMRIRLIKLPDDKKCQYLDLEKIEICGKYTEDYYCRKHINDYLSNIDKLVFNPLQQFYLDENNINFADSELLESLVNSVKFYCLNKHEIDNALNYFDITRPDKNLIKNRYRKMARKYHPDKKNGSVEKMKELNYKYQILKEVFII